MRLPLSSSIGRRLALAGLCLAAAGCLRPFCPLAPASQAPEPGSRGSAGAPAPATAGEPAAGAAAAPGMATESDPPPGPLGLAELLDLALAGSPAAQVAWAEARAAAAAYGAERGRWLPELDGTLSVSRARRRAAPGQTAAEVDLWGPALSLSYLLFDLGERPGAIEAARQTLRAAEFARQAAVRELVLAVELGYFDLLAVQALLDSRWVAEREAQLSLEAAGERHRVGLATIADVLQARTALSAAVLDRQAAEGRLAASRATLALAAGLPADLALEVRDLPVAVAPAELADALDELVAGALERRPDLAAAQARAGAAQARVRLERGQALPRLELAGSWSDQRYLDESSLNGDAYAVAIDLEVPLFAGFSDRCRAAEARYLARAAEAQAAGIRLQVISQVVAAAAAVRTAAQQLQTAEDLVTAATQSEEVALGRYREGVGSILDLVTAQSRLAAARASRIEARYGWLSALARLAHDAGRPISEVRP